MEARILATIFVGGCVGTLGRLGLIQLTAPRAGHWPWATLIANVVGAGILGWAAAHWPAPARARFLIGTGFCGALTTFSTFQLELLHLLDADRVGLAMAYGTTSLVLGLIVARWGAIVARRGRPRT